MEESIGKVCSTMAKFCNHLQTNCLALKESVDRRPIPLDSASTTFIQSVNRRISAAGDDLNMLESMSFGTVSFEELLGHCNEVLKRNQTDISAIQEHLSSSSSYIPPIDFDEEDVVDDYASDYSFTSDNGLKRSVIAYEDPLLDDSMSLKKFGISDVSLQTIASQADNNFEMDEPEFLHLGETADEMNQYEDPKLLLSVSREDFESLPKHMKGLVSWEDLEDAVRKMKSYLQAKKIKPDSFGQDEIESIGLGHKARSYLLLLIKMNRLCVETNEGRICYRIV